jgi:hypothetical protein
MNQHHTPNSSSPPRVAAPIVGRVLVFRASHVLKAQINEGMAAKHGNKTTGDDK